MFEILLHNNGRIIIDIENTIVKIIFARLCHLPGCAICSNNDRIIKQTQIPRTINANTVSFSYKGAIKDLLGSLVRLVAARGINMITKGSIYMVYPITFATATSHPNESILPSDVLE